MKLSTIRPNTQKFLDLKPTLICTINDYKFYEDPIHGDEGFLVAITPRGRVRRTCFTEVPSVDELEYQIEEWSKKVVVYYTDGLSGDMKNKAKIVDSLTGLTICECPTHLAAGWVKDNGLTCMKDKRVNHEIFETLGKGE